MSRSLFLSIVLAACIVCEFSAPESVDAQTRRALLIGINKYKPEGVQEKSIAANTIEVSATAQRKPRGGFNDLDGCTNDVDVIRDILVARYDFKAEHIYVLKDTNATRENILGSFRKRLIDDPSPGDEVFFYYAGHGSQVKNLKSAEQDSLDETIVPADAYRGVPDIRDKEIRRLFNQVLDKGLILTAVFDCCHSGSISRGLPREGKTRFLARDPNDVADGGDLGPAPAERGALVFSAAHEFQLAGEARDEQDSAHGAFTLAFASTLRTAPKDETAQNIFLRVKAQMQAGGRLQEPDMDGPTRTSQPLLGKGGAGGSGKIRVAVLTVDPDEKLIELQGGYAVGIRDSCELRKAGTTTADGATRLKVVEVKGLSRSTATLVSGDLKAIRPGDLFEISRWTVPNAAILSVWIPSGTMSVSDLKSSAQELEKLRSSDRLHWVEDPTIESPSHMVSWGGKEWKVTNANGVSTPLGRHLTADRLIPVIGNGAKLFVSLPPSAPLRSGIHLGKGTENDAIDAVAIPDNAHYYLVGRWDGKSMQYAWVLPRITQREKDSLNLPLPIRSDWVTPGETDKSNADAASLLQEYALRMGKLRAWLALDMPPEEGTFPYALALRNVSTGDRRTDGTVFDREKYTLVLRAAPEKLKQGIEPRYVYVLVIDSYGNSTLLFPSRTGGNLENRVPFNTDEGVPLPEEIPLGMKPFTISKPFGIDSYVLLTSQEAIASPGDLEAKGIRTRGDARGGQTPLAKFLFGVGSATRGVESPTPTNWSVSRMSIKSAARTQ